MIKGFNRFCNNHLKIIYFILGCHQDCKQMGKQDCKQDPQQDVNKS